MARNLDRATREAKLEAIRRQNAADAKRARLLQTIALVVAGVLVVLVVLAIVLTGRDEADDVELTYPEQTTLLDEDRPGSGAFLLGEEGEVDVVVYEDFQCPACRAFERESGPYLAELALSDEVSLLKRPIAILDRVTGDGIYSTRSAAAAACVGSTRDDEAYAAFSDALFAEQPPEAEPGDGLTDARLVELAARAGADGPEVETCIVEGTFVPWAAESTQAAGEALDRLSTPTVLVDGEVVTGAEGGYPSTDELRAAVEAAVAGG